MLSERLHVRDRESGLVFLIDTGCDISLLSTNTGSGFSPDDLVLNAAKNTRINTFLKRH